MKTTELKELMPPHVVDVQGHGINEFYTPEQVVEILRLLVVSDSLLRSKAKEYAKFKHQDEYNDPTYHRDVLETLNDFEAGYKAALKDCNER